MSEHNGEARMKQVNHCNGAEDRVVVLGGGLAGLSAGYILSTAGRPVAVFEHDSVVGGISKTIERRGFRFDLGPHRFFTKNAHIETFVKNLMGDELLIVPRRTRIFIRGKYFDYPLEPVNAVFGMGLFTTLNILGDYGLERIKRLFRRIRTHIAERLGYCQFRADPVRYLLQGVQREGLGNLLQCHQRRMGVQTDQRIVAIISRYERFF